MQINPLLKTALENLAKFRKELISKESGEGSALDREDSPHAVQQYEFDDIDGLPRAHEDETVQLIERL